MKTNRAASAAVRAAAMLFPALLQLPLASASPLTAALTDKIAPSIGCPGFRSDFYDGLYRYWLNAQPLPAADEMATAFGDLLQSSRYQSLTAAEKIQLTNRLSTLYRVLGTEAVKALSKGDPASALEAVSGLELGDRTTADRERLQAEIASSVAAIQELAGRLSCEPPPTRTQPAARAEPPLFTNWRENLPAPVFGALKTFATAYQSCDAGTRPVLTAGTPDLKGVAVIGTHPDGIGCKRKISDLSALLSTHPYLSNYHRPDSSCFDVLKSPLIYNYGGKPFVVSDSDYSLDLFQHAGTGTNVLGVDCSGYMFTSFASAGLRLVKGEKIKPTLVAGTRAVQWMNPQKGGLTCFDHPQFTKSMSLLAGDVLASGGHVIMIANVSDDPFGISGFTSPSECTPANMSVTRFDFTVLQSAPVKGGIGIDHIRGSDYFLTSKEDDMSSALLELAVTACLARTKGVTLPAKSTRAGLVRHLGTPDCIDDAVHLAHEECLASCSDREIASEEFAAGHSPAHSSPHHTTPHPSHPTTPAHGGCVPGLL